MLKQLTLENFKAFGKRTVIDLAPITLIFGANSAGKSSILQSLSLLKQTVEFGQSGTALLPRVEGNFVDLGSYHDLIFNHDSSKRLRIGVTCYSRYREPTLYSNPSGTGLEITFRRNAKSGEIVVSNVNVTREDSRRPLARFRARKAKRDEQRELRRYGRYGSFARRVRPRGVASTDFVAQCTALSGDEDFWRPIYEEWFARRTEIVEHLTQELEGVGDEIDDDSPIDAPKKRADRYADAIDFYSKEFELEQFVERVSKAGIGHVMLLDGFFPEPSRLSRMWEDVPELEMVFARPPGSGKRIRRFFDVGALAFYAGADMANSLEKLFPMGPYRRPPDRYYIFTGTSPVDVGYEGDHLPDLLYRDKDLVTKANDWLRKLEIGYQLDIRAIGDIHQSDLFEVKLIDEVRDIDVALADVGFGISQILPFLVQSLASEKQIIAIEQPEVHIHPGLQADLGNLIAEGIKQPHGHQYLIETHSEHLILRIQKLIRQKGLKPEDVSVLYVSREESGSTVKRLRLDDQGDFVDDWPGGFFSERLLELV